MKDKKIVLFPGFRHVVPADFESWLEKMASAGWHIDRITQWSSFVMVFRRGAPKKYRFVYDLQAAPRKDYRAIYQEFGWEYLGRMASVFIWRKEYRDARLEAFSDQESILQRNRRTLIAVSIAFYMFLLAALILGLSFFTRTLAPGELFQAVLALALFLAIAAYLGRVMLKIGRKREY